VGGALLGGAAGAGLGAGLGFLLPVERFREVAPFSAFAVALFAMPAGVTFAGHQMHGNGGLGWSAAGLLGGAVLALPLIALAERSSAFQGTIAVVFPLAGAIIGYEVSSDDDARAHTGSPPPLPPRVVPTALVVPGGALAGLAGRF
jgi:NhaP-type Na+/H+ or K+/H+ antiporter